MYVILVYDIESARVSKMLKLCRSHLHWIQNSVFEGEITKATLKNLLHKAKHIMNTEKDSLIIFMGNEKWLQKQTIGIEKNKLDNIL